MKFWISGFFILIFFGFLNAYMEAQEHAANEAYRARLEEKRRLAQVKMFNDLAARGEFMTTFKDVKK